MIVRYRLEFQFEFVFLKPQPPSELCGGMKDYTAKKLMWEPDYVKQLEEKQPRVLKTYKGLLASRAAMRTAVAVEAPKTTKATKTIEAKKAMKGGGAMGAMKLQTAMKAMKAMKG